MVNQIQKRRDSGVELLRIFAAIGVIFIHIGDGRLSIVGSNNLNHYAMIIAESIAHCSVDLFILITGYYSICSNKRSIGKPLSLLFQVFLFQFAWYFLLVITARVDISLYSFCKYCSPNNYFVILFIALYLISPYINRLLLSFSKMELKNFVLITGSIFSLYAIVVDLYGELMGIKWFGLSSFGAWGSQQGFNIVNFIFVYIVGAYIRIMKIPIYTSTKNAIIIFVGCIFLSSVWAEFNFFLPKNGLWSAWCYHNPLMIFMSVSLFILFSKINFSSTIVNRMAPAAFMCYIFHVKVLSLFPLNKILLYPVYIMIPLLFMLALVLFAVSWVLYELYTLLFSRIFKLLDTISIHYFD